MWAQATARLQRALATLRVDPQTGKIGSAANLQTKMPPLPPPPEGHPPDGYPIPPEEVQRLFPNLAASGLNIHVFREVRTDGTSFLELAVRQDNEDYAGITQEVNADGTLGAVTYYFQAPRYNSPMLQALVTLLGFKVEEASADAVLGNILARVGLEDHPDIEERGGYSDGTSQYEAQGKGPWGEIRLYVDDSYDSWRGTSRDWVHISRVVFSFSSSQSVPLGAQMLFGLALGIAPEELLLETDDKRGTL